MPTYEELLQQALRGPAAIPIEDQNRSPGEWVKDTALSAAANVAAIPEAIAGLGQLVPGVSYLADPIARGFGTLRESAYAAQSPIAQAARQRLGQAIQQGEWGTALGEAFTPSNLVDLGMMGIGSLGGMKLLGMGARSLAPVTYGRMAATRGLLPGAMEGLYTAGAIGSGIAGEEGGWSPERLAAIPAGALTGLIGGASARYLPDVEQAMFGGLGAEQQMLARGAGAAQGSLAQRMSNWMAANPYARVGISMGKEAGEEFLQSGQESIWQQLAQQGYVNPGTVAAEALVGAVPGGMMGGVFGYLNKPVLPPDMQAEKKRLALHGDVERISNLYVASGVTPQDAYFYAVDDVNQINMESRSRQQGALGTIGEDIAPNLGYQIPLRSALAGELAPSRISTDPGIIYQAPTEPFAQQSRSLDMRLAGEREQRKQAAYNRILNPQPGEPSLGRLDLTSLARVAPSAFALEAMQPQGGLPAGVDLGSLYYSGRNQQIIDRIAGRMAGNDIDGIIEELYKNLDRPTARSIEWQIRNTQMPVEQARAVATQAIQRNIAQQGAFAGIPEPTFGQGQRTIPGAWNQQWQDVIAQQEAAAQQAAAAEEARLAEMQATRGQTYTQQGDLLDPLDIKQVPTESLEEALGRASLTQIAPAMQTPAGVQPDLLTSQFIRDAINYEHNLKIDSQAIAAARKTLAKIQQNIFRLGANMLPGRANELRTREAKAIANLEEMLLDDKINKKRLATLLDYGAKQNASASQILAFIDPSNKYRYGKRGYLGQNVKPRALPEQPSLGLLSEQISPATQPNALEQIPTYPKYDVTSPEYLAQQAEYEKVKPAARARYQADLAARQQENARIAERVQAGNQIRGAAERAYRQGSTEKVAPIIAKSKERTTAEKTAQAEKRKAASQREAERAEAERAAAEQEVTPLPAEVVTPAGKPVATKGEAKVTKTTLAPPAARYKQEMLDRYKGDPAAAKAMDKAEAAALASREKGSIPKKVLKEFFEKEFKAPTAETPTAQRGKRSAAEAGEKFIQDMEQREADLLYDGFKSDIPNDPLFSTDKWSNAAKIKIDASEKAMEKLHGPYIATRVKSALAYFVNTKTRAKDGVVSNAEYDDLVLKFNEKKGEIIRELKREQGKPETAPVQRIKRGESSSEKPKGVKHIKLPSSTGEADIINAGRIVTLLNINGVNIPFYISTGDGGKTKVPVGKWYPFFGVGVDGWLNKTTEEDINNYYGSEKLKQAAQWLDKTYGDLRSKENELPKATGTAKKIDPNGPNEESNYEFVPHLKVINKDVPAIWREAEGAYEYLKKEIQTIVDKIEGRTPEVATSKDPYINALATTLDNPTYSNPLVSEETRQSLASIETLLQQSDTDSSQLDIKRTADISDDELSARRAKAAETLDKLNEQFAALEASVKGGRKAIQAAQAASKGRVAAAGEPSQTSAASQFSRFYGGYINQSQGLTLDLATETAWREPNEKPLDKLPSDPAATELERDGKLTTRTRLGKIALGRTVTEKERNAVHEQTRKDLEAINVGNNLPGNEDSMQQRVESHAAVDFLLREIIAKKAFNKLFPNLARTLQAALRRTGLLHAIEVQYFPHDHRQASAEYEFVKGINSPDRHIIKIYGERFVNDKYFLHEVLHAATAAFVLNNPTAPEVAAFTAILDNAKVQAFLKKKTSKFENRDKRFENMDVPHQILELIAYGFTDADFINLLRNTQIKRSDYDTPKGQKNFDTLAGFMKEAGNQLRNMYRAFVNTIRSIFKAQTGELNGFDAFLESYARMMTAIETGAEVTEKQGGSAREMMSPSKGVSLQAVSTTDGDLIEKAKYEEDARQDARAAEERRKILADRESRANAIPPSQQRNLTAAESAIAEDTVQNRRKIEQRSGYSIPDAPMKLLSAWIPKLWTKYAGEDSKYLREGIGNYAARNQRQGRFLSKIIDNFGLHPLFAAAWREAKNRVGFVDHLAYLVNSNSELSWNETIQKEFLSAVDSGKETGRYWLDRLVKEFRHAVDLAKEYNRLPAQLRNAPYSNIYIWNEGEQVKRFHGFKYSGLGNIFTRHNGHIYEGVDAFLGMPQADNTMPLSMWAKESIGPGGKPTYQFAFINQSIDDTAQEQAILRRYGPGFKKSSHTYYRVDDNRAYRPFTFAEKKAMDKKASAIRSAAAFIQDINHYVVGLQFGDEMIAENDPLDDDAKFLFELNDKNLQYLKDKVGEKRIIYFDQDKGPTHNKLMRTPGNWVVLRGTKWGKLDGEKTYIAPASVFSALYDYNTMEHMLLPQTLRKINRFWKRNMTVWSTMAHANNMMSALITMYMHDIHVDDIKLAAKIIYKLVTKPESLTAQERAFYEEAERRGSLFGTFSVEEGVTGILEEQLKALEDVANGDSSFANLLSAAAAIAGPMTNGLKKARDAGVRLDRFMGDLYANEDNVFRLAAYMGKVRELTLLNDDKPLSEAALQKAGSWAADINVNYDINAKYIKYARESFWPFIAWPYRQVGNMAKLAVTKPWKLLNITAAFYLLDTLAYAMLGMSDDDRDWEKEVLPPYMKEGLWGLSFAPSYIRTPTGDGKTSGVFWGGARAVPTADLTMVNDGMFVPQIAAPGGPMALAYQAITNRDLFHDKPIMDDFVTPKENFESMMSFILRGMAPATLTRAVDVIDKVGGDKRGPLGSETNAYIELARLMGLNVREVNFAEAAYNKSIADKNSIQKIKANMRRAINRELRYGTPDQDAIQQTLDEYNNLRLNWMEQ